MEEVVIKLSNEENGWEVSFPFPKYEVNKYVVKVDKQFEKKISMIAIFKGDYKDPVWENINNPVIKYTKACWDGGIVYLSGTYKFSTLLGSSENDMKRITIILKDIVINHPEMPERLLNLDKNPDVVIEQDGAVLRFIKKENKNLPQKIIDTKQDIKPLQGPSSILLNNLPVRNNGYKHVPKIIIPNNPLPKIIPKPTFQTANTQRFNANTMPLRQVTNTRSDFTRNVSNIRSNNMNQTIRKPVVYTQKSFTQNRGCGCKGRI